jgi:26S proteasome regulatory subunit N1
MMMCRNECDPALALLSDYVLHNSNVMRIGAIFGLGLAYAGSNRYRYLPGTL